MKKNNLRPRIEVTSVHQMLMSVRQAALLLAVSQRTITRFIERGTLPSVKLGKRRLLRYADLLSMAENGTDIETLRRVRSSIAAK